MKRTLLVSAALLATAGAMLLWAIASYPTSATVGSQDRDPHLQAVSS